MEVDDVALDVKGCVAAMCGLTGVTSTFGIWYLVFGEIHFRMRSPLGKFTFECGRRWGNSYSNAVAVGEIHIRMRPRRLDAPLDECDADIDVVGVSARLSGAVASLRVSRAEGTSVGALSIGGLAIDDHVQVRRAWECGATLFHIVSFRLS